MKLYEVLDLLYETNEVIIKERPHKHVAFDKVKDILKNEDIDLSRNILSIRPITPNCIQLFLEDR